MRVSDPFDLGLCDMDTTFPGCLETCLCPRFNEGGGIEGKTLHQMYFICVFGLKLIQSAVYRDC